MVMLILNIYVLIGLFEWNINNIFIILNIDRYFYFYWKKDN